MTTLTQNGNTVKRIGFRLDDWATAFGVSRRTIDRLRAEGKLPVPDLVMGRIPMWKEETVTGFINSQPNTN